MKKSTSDFWQSAEMNNQSYLQHFNRLVNLYISRFSLKDAPDTLNRRFIESVLLSDGKILFFNNEVGDLVALPFTDSGELGIYGDPFRRRPYSNASNVVFSDKDVNNSVIVYSNLSKIPDILSIRYFARKLYMIDRAIDVNVASQRTPVLITCDKNTEFSAKQMQAKVEGNQAYIFVDKSSDFGESFKALQTQSPYNADKLNVLKENVFADALSNGGIDNVTSFKRERLITDEVNKSQGGTLASRFSSLEARNQGIFEVNKMFGTTMKYEFNAFQDEQFVNELENINEQFKKEVGVDF